MASTLHRRACVLHRLAGLHPPNQLSEFRPIQEFEATVTTEPASFMREASRGHENSPGCSLAHDHAKQFSNGCDSDCVGSPLLALHENLLTRTTQPDVHPTVTRLVSH